MKLQDIVEIVGGTIIAGDAALEITGASGLGFATPTDISYVGEAKFLPELKVSQAGAVFVTKKEDTDKAQISHPNPPLAFARILERLHSPPQSAVGIHPRAVLDENAHVGTDASIFPNVYIGKNSVIGDRAVLHAGVVIGDDCQIGNDVVMHPNVVLYNNSVLGNHVTLHAGAVIGADGFSYTPDEKGRHVKLQQIGKVVIRDHVEIGANTTIDRAAFGETIIGEGVKIDNLVQIGHNCNIGEHSVIVSQVGISGSSTLGKHNVIAGQVGISDHVTTTDQVTLLARSGVFRNITESGLYGWTPAMKGTDLMKFMPIYSRLPELAAKIKEHSRRLDSIENG